MMNGLKTTAEAAIQLPETKATDEAAKIVTMNGPLAVASNRRKHDVTSVVLRLACLLTSVTALSLMVTAEESSAISIFGFSLPLYSKWSFFDSFE